MGTPQEMLDELNEHRKIERDLARKLEKLGYSLYTDTGKPGRYMTGTSDDKVYAEKYYSEKLE